MTRFSRGRVGVCFLRSVVLVNTVNVGQVGLPIALLEEVCVVVEEGKQWLKDLSLVLVVDSGVCVSDEGWVTQQGHIQLEHLVQVGDGVLCGQEENKEQAGSVF